MSREGSAEVFALLDSVGCEIRVTDVDIGVVMGDLVIAFCVPDEMYNRRHFCVRI